MKCLRCQASFVRHGRQVYCTPRCRAAAQRERSRTYETVVCKRCREPYERISQSGRKTPGRCRACVHVRGKDHHKYNGGLSQGGTSGRWQITCRDGSHAYYYRAVMEAHLGRDLRSDEQVHHLNGDAQDDRIENLALMTKKEHMRLHMIKRNRDAVRERMQTAEDRWQLATLWQETYGEEYPGAVNWRAMMDKRDKAERKAA